MCPLCEQGHIGIARCPHCEEYCALCDDCEAIWRDPYGVNSSKPNGQHPYCPHCEEAVNRWIFGNRIQLSKAGFDDLIDPNSR